MGLRYRKSFNFGLFRINLSKTGIGYSIGTKGYRKTKRADGRNQITYSIPNTGISYVETYKGKEKVKGVKKKRNIFLNIIIYTLKFFKGFCSLIFWSIFISIAILVKSFCYMCDILNN